MSLFTNLTIIMVFVLIVFFGGLLSVHYKKKQSKNKHA